MIDAFIYGLQDTFSPLQFANLLIFTLLLFSRGSNPKLVLTVSGAYLLSLVMTIFTAAFGTYDKYYTDVIVVEAIRNVFVVIGGFFIVIGVGSALDWFSYNFTNRDKLLFNWPVGVIDSKREVKPSFIQVILKWSLFPYVAGAVMTFMSMVWQEAFIFEMFSYTISQKDMLFTISIFMGYFLGMVVPFVFVSSVYSALIRMRAFHDVALSSLKIITAAAGIGLGVNLIWLRFI